MNTIPGSTYLGHRFPVLQRLSMAAVLLMLLAIGAHAQTAGSLNPSFTPGTGGNSSVLGIARQGDGKLVIGGRFTTFNGVARNRVARLNYDGSLDASFNPGLGADSTVNAVAVGADGKVVVGGDFFTVNGASRSRLARFHANGSLDSTFAPVVDGTVQAVAVDSVNRVYLAGSFTHVNGIARARVARVNVDGSLDSSFNPGTGPNSFVLGLELQADGKVLLAGYFSSVNGVTRHRVARLNTDGTLDTTFVPGTLDNGYANFVSVGGDGKILVGGGLYVGESTRLVRLHPDGSVDTTFNAGINAINSDVMSAVSHADGTVLIAGYFSSVSGFSRNGVARLLANGRLDTSFDPGVGADNRVSVLLLEPDGSFVAGGDFTTYQGVSRNRITRIHSLFINQAPTFTVTNSTILEDSMLASVTVTGIAAGPVGDGLTVVPQVVTNLTATSSNPALVPHPLVTYAAGATTATLAFTPLANATGTVTITVVAQDNAGTANLGNDRSTNTFTLTVAPVNDAPSFTLATSALSSVGAVGEQSVPAFAANILPGPANEAGQTVSFSVANNNNLLFSTQPAIGANGTLTFTPALMANGVATVTVNAQDNGGTANGGVDTSTAQTFTITVISGNVPPSASYATNNVVVLEDAAAQTVGAFATFSAGPVNENTQTVSLVSVTAANPALFSSQPALAANGTLTFTPAANANGATLVTVVVADDGGTVSGGADRATNTFTITVTPVNDAPSFALPAGSAAGGSLTHWGRTGSVVPPAGLTGLSAVAAADSHVVALKTDGTVIAWGDNGNGQATVPAGLSGVVGVFTGSSAAHSYALRSDGTLVGWGANGDGRATPPAGLSGVVSVAVGEAHNVALKSDGTVVAWGSTYYGQTSVPGGLSGVLAVASGRYHSLAVKSDGTVVGWGYNGDGRATPPAGLNNVTAVVAGNAYSAALKSDGTVVAWGSPTQGGTVPAGLSGVVALAGGYNHVLALKADGSIVGWGINGSGETTIPAGLTGVSQLTAGAGYSIALSGGGSGSYTLTVAEDSGAYNGSGFVTSIHTGPANESGQVVSFVVTNDNNALFSSQPAISTAGALTFTPAPNATGTATVTVYAQDNGGTDNGGVNSAGPQTFTVTVNAVNDAPVITFAASTVTVAEDSGATNIVGFATVTTGPANESSQTITNFTVTSDNPTLFSVAPALTGGALSFTPAAGANGSALVTVVAQDDGGTDNGGANQTTRTFTITVSDFNDPPVITFASNVVVLQNSGAASLATFASITTGPANESSQSITNLIVSNDNTGLFSAQPALSGGTLTFTPALNAVGLATVTVIAQDNGGTVNGGVDKATNTFTISVIGVNHAPTFALRPVNTQSSLLSNGSFETGSFTGWTATDTANSTPTLAVRANGANLGFFNVVSSDGTYSATHGFSGATAGSISIAQDVTLPPGGGGTLSFTYRAAWQTFNAAGDRVFRFAVQPGGGGADLLSQTILTATPNSFVFQTASTPVSVDLSAFAGQSVRLVFVTDIAAGDAGNGSFQLDNVRLSATTPNFTVFENSGASSTLNFATNILAGPPGEAAQTVAFLVANNNNGLFSSQPAIAADGTLTFTPALNANGLATVTVRAQDNGGTDNGGTDTSVPHTFSITVLPVNSAPGVTLNTAELVVNEDRGAYSGTIATITTGAADESSQSITNLVTSNNNNALFSVQPAVSAGGVLTFTPVANANGSAVVTLSVQDDGGTANGGVNLTTRTFTITVTPVNDAPSFALPLGPLLPAGQNWILQSGYPQSDTPTIGYAPDGSRLMAGQWNGHSYLSTDHGVTWVARNTDTTRAYQGGFAFSADGSRIYAAPRYAPMLTSADGGTTWTTLPLTPGNNGFWTGVACSSSGQVVIGGNGDFGYLYTSTDYGATWTAHLTDAVRGWGGVAASSDGSVLAAASYARASGSIPDRIYISTDSGATWTARGPTAFWTGVACSADGTKLVATTDGGQIHTSTDAGLNWTARESARSWGRPVSSADGNTLLTIASGVMYRSTDAGVTWVQETTRSNWRAVTMTADGATFAATLAGAGSRVYTSSAGHGPYALAVAEDSGAYTGGANLATSISSGPADESAQTVSFNVSNNNNPLFSSQPAIAADGTLTFTPAANAFGSATVTVTAVDSGSGTPPNVNTSAAQTFIITVTPVNDQPTVTLAGNVTRNEDSGAYSQSSFATFSAGNASESGQAVLAYTVSNSSNALFSVQPAINTSGTLTFTPAANAHGVATVTVSVQDNGGTANSGVDTSASVTFTITINSVNDAPSFALPAGPPPPGAAWGALSAGAQQWSRIVASADGTKLAAIFSGGLIHTSADSGTTWTAQTGSGSRNWISIASSADGTKLAAAVNGGGIYTSADSGVTWTLQAGAGTRGWGYLGMSPDGSRLIASGYFIPAFGSTDGGVTWTQVQTSRQWGPITIAADNLKVSMVETGGPIYTSLDFGANWFTGTGTAGNLNPMAASADGTKLVTAASQFGTIYTSTNSGTNWTSRESVRTWIALASSADGSFLVAAVQNGLIYTSADSGVTWTPQPAAGSRNWSSLAISADGSRIYATDAASGGFIYSSAGTLGGYNLTVLEDSGDYTGSGFATGISPGPADESAQVVDFLLSNNNNALFSSQPAVDASGTLTFTPAANAFGSATVTVQAHDDGGTANGGVDTSAAQTFTITVTSLNDAPSITFATNNVAVLQDTGAFSGSQATFGVGPANEAAQSITNLVTSNNNNSLFSVQPSVALDGTLTFTPATNAFGSATVTVIAQDNGGTANGGVDKATNTFTIAIGLVNKAPTFGIPGGNGANWNRTVLIIWDMLGDDTLALKRSLEGAGMTVTLSAVDRTRYDGTNPSPDGFGAVIHLNGLWSFFPDLGSIQSMPVAGQNALVTFVQNGGGYIQSEWDAFHYSAGRLANMRELILFDHSSHASGQITYTNVPAQAGHPVLSGMGSSFSFNGYVNVGSVHTFASNPATVLMRDTNGSDAVAVRQYGSGRIVGFSHAGNYSFSGYGTLGDGNLQQLYVNAARWVAGGTAQGGTTRVGSLWAWGYNGNGQLGDGLPYNHFAPEQIGRMNWRFLAAGNASAGIQTDGTLWMWGPNFSGQLGNGTTQSKSVPTQVGSASNWSAVATVDHTVALKTDGTLWAWGHNGQGQLGDGTTTGRLTPAQVGTDANWKAVALGYNHTVAVKTDGTLWAWGDNSKGQLGDGTTTGRLTPVQIGTDANWKAVAAGGLSTLVLKTDGTLWACGYNGQGQLGDGTTTDQHSPVQVGTDTNWKDMSISFGGGFALATKTDGTLWGWGNNSNGRLGDGTNTERHNPVQIGTDMNWKEVRAGSQHSVGLKTDGTVWTWGNWQYGQLAENTNGDRYSPQQVGTSHSWQMVAAGANHVLALGGYSDALHGSLFAAGYNGAGQLGDGTTTPRNSLVSIGTDTEWQSVVSGQDHTLAIKTDGSLWSWGLNNFGQLGNFTTGGPDQLTPQLVPNGMGNFNWKMVSAGGNHSAALRADGVLYMWGRNAFGQLGRGDNLDRNIPTQLDGNDWKAVACGGEFTVAVKNDGSVWSWGRNSIFQLGVGDQVDRNSPVQVLGPGSGVIGVAAGTEHALAISSGGGIVAWGRGGEGQLGDGSGLNRSRPVGLNNGGQFVAVAAGVISSYAVKLDGSLFAWGDNQFGQLGDGTGTRRYSPTQVGTDAWLTVSSQAGAWHALGIKPDGTLWGWGRNEYGQLGTGGNRNVPTQVGTNSNWVAVAAGANSSFALSGTSTTNAASSGPSGPYDLTVVEGSGAHSVSSFATNISAGPITESAQVVSFVVTNDNNALFSVQPAISTGGTLTFTTAANGTGTATVTVYAQDDGGTANGGVDLAGPQTFTITVTPVPTRVHLSGATPAGPQGQTLVVPIVLDAIGTESAVGFTLNFDAAKLTYAGTVLGANASGASLLENAAPAASGRVGLLLTRPAGGGGFSAGSNQLVLVSFTVNPAAALGSTPVTFTDVVTRREVADASATVMPAAFEDGSVTITAAAAGTPSTYEGDVAPRPYGSGNGTVTVADAVQISRFAAGLDTATSANGEFQRADCAPLGTKGDGRITVADWLQTQRFAASLDTAGAVGGPTVQAAGLMATSAKLPAGSRVVRVVGGNLVAGRANAVSVQVDAQGNEAGVSLSLAFDPTVLSYVSATVGGGARGGSLVVNSSKAGSGRLGLVLVLPAGSALAAGAQEIITLTFQVNGSGSTAITVNGDAPVAREVADVNANPVGASFVGGTFTIQLPAGLKAAGMERAADGSLRLVVRNADGTLVTAAQAARYEVQVTSNLGGSWTVLPNALVVEGGALKIVDPAANGAGLRLYKLVEKP